MTWPAGWGVVAPCWGQRGEQLATGGGGMSEKPAPWPQAGSSLAGGLSRVGHRPAAWGFPEGTCVEDGYSGDPACRRHPLRQEVRLTAQVWGGPWPVPWQVPGHLSCWWSVHPHPPMPHLCLPSNGE